MLHVEQPDVASDVRPETKPLVMGPSLFFYFDQDDNLSNKDEWNTVY